ncbi:glutaredoxin 3 [Wenzhouxiangella limi]|uniref:Glutaredoxin n=1 Tax=Wenzhouxiangella limi TaxID=2707351 RepID=A0A845UY06_9GAMM|nr:glutaredoxin 3 [Wenzhouxiangella limi]NDY96733.1 glutaredoxin 3 [Wenzhouxiangella limi]
MDHQPVVMYCTSVCPFCVAARHLLQAKGVSWTEVPIDQQSEKRAEMMQRSGRHTVPQVFIGDRHVGGFDELNQLEQRGELDRWLAASGE